MVLVVLSGHVDGTPIGWNMPCENCEMRSWEAMVSNGRRSRYTRALRADEPRKNWCNENKRLLQCCTTRMPL